MNGSTCADTSSLQAPIQIGSYDRSARGFSFSMSAHLLSNVNVNVPNHKHEVSNKGAHFVRATIHLRESNRALGAYRRRSCDVFEAADRKRSTTCGMGALTICWHIDGNSWNGNIHVLFTALSGICSSGDTFTS